MAPRVSKIKKSVKKVYTAKSRSRFLELPSELREQIYNEVLQNHPSALFNLLLVNPKITKEVKPYIFKRSLIFDGQAELYDWLDKVEHGFLRLVVDVQFKLHDLTPRDIVESLSKRLLLADVSELSVTARPHPYEDACKLEIERLGKAFQLFPNLRHFTVLTTTTADPRPPSTMVFSFAETLFNRFPDLYSFTNHEDRFPMFLVADLQNLRRLRFPGRCVGISARLEAALSALPNLVDLEVCRPDSARAPNHLAPQVVQRGELSDVADIIRGLTQLRSFVFYEYIYSVQDPSMHARLMLPAMDTLSALESHKTSLRTLKLLIDIDLEPWMKTKLALFVKNSSLTHLETFDSDFPPLQFVPATIETIILRCGLRRIPFDSWLEELVTMTKTNRARLTNLREVVIYLNLMHKYSDSEEKCKLWVKRCMRKMGILLRWKGWNGDPPSD